MNLLAVALSAGAVQGWVMVVAAVGIAYTLWRGNAGSAVTVLRDANKILVDKMESEHQLRRKFERENTVLQAKTDFSAALAPIAKELAQHRAQHDAMLHVLDLIAIRLGPDPAADEP